MLQVIILVNVTLQSFLQSQTVMYVGKLEPAHTEQGAELYQVV